MHWSVDLKTMVKFLDRFSASPCTIDLIDGFRLIAEIGDYEALVVFGSRPGKRTTSALMMILRR